MVASLFQVAIGFTGLIGILLRFIGPLTIAPTITLVGVALFHLGAEHSGKLTKQFNYCFILLSFHYLFNLMHVFFILKEITGGFQ